MNPAHWQLLILTLPGDNAAARVRIWRALKALGCGALRDGVYLLPLRQATQGVLAQQVGPVEAIGGTAWLLDVEVDAGTSARLAALFDRSDDYAALIDEIAACQADLAALEPVALRRQLKGLRRSLEGLLAIDYFPGAGRAEAQSRLAELERLAQARLHPDEPRAQQADIPLRDRADYRGRLWATRRDLWVDRVASAWLIRRFVDPDAAFRWLAKPADCPADALGFDFDGAAFSHVGERVTFETLLASFGLEADAALMRLGRVIHALDVGGLALEAGGLEAVLKGMKARLRDDDDTLLDEAGRVLDDLYRAFQKELHPS